MQEKTNLSVGIYVRVSSEERAKEGYSIDTQTRLLKMFCESQGWTKTELYVDPGHSAKDMDRPEFKRLKKDIENKKINILLVYRLDRMTRNIRDLFDILSLLDEHGAGFKSATENYDTTTAMGRMFIGLVGLLAQWERENLGERVTITMKQKILIDNEASGAQPYGYRIEDKKRVINEEEKEIVLLMIEQFYSIGSVAGVAQELNRRNIPTRTKKTSWSHQTVRQVLRNPALCGTVVYSGEIVENAFESILTPDEFGTLSRRIEKQNIIRLRAPTKGLFSGMLKCPQCNRTMVKASDTYRCNKCYENNKGLIKVNEKFIKEAFLKYVRHNSELDPADQNKKKKVARSIGEEISRLEQKRAKYQQMYADDFMTYIEFQQNLTDNEKETARLRNEQIEGEEEVNIEEVRKYRWKLTESFDSFTKEEAIEFTGLFVKEISFNRTCIKHDKNGVPKAYEYVVTDVKYKGL
ncbi:recombinase family protein [Sporosarcina sp. FSL K6-5500]|uniref:recombinase family protein n=1 Tax=Sporosarcina sp. FSL K6-5500 TaxID=2921558 RepID=UPI0030FD0FAF